MSWIGRALTGLERRGQPFVVEALAAELPPEWVDAVLTKSGRQSQRVRALPAAFTVWFVILLGLHRRVGYVNLLEKLDDTWWTRDHWSPEAPPSSSAVSKARDRVGVTPLRQLFERSAVAWAEGGPGRTFYGRRVVSLDGHTLKTPDAPANRKHFGLPGASRGASAFPQLRLVALDDLGPRVLRAVRVGTYGTGEHTLMRRLLPDVPRHALALLDRHFIAWALLWDLVHQRQADFVLRLKHNVEPTTTTALGPGDVLGEFAIHRNVRRQRPDLPATWLLRIVETRVPGSDEPLRLLTTLTDPAIPAQAIADLYRERWEQESAMDEIKTHLLACATVNHPVVFRSQTPQRVLQELYGILIAYNLLRRLMVRAVTPDTVAARAGDPEPPAGNREAPAGDPCRLSFTAALERTREAVWDMARLATPCLCERYERLLHVISRAKVPFRPGRHEPRAVRVKMSGYPLKRRRTA